MPYSPNGSWSINNACDIHGSTNIVQDSLIAHGVVCIVHGSIRIIHGSAPKMLIYHEFCGTMSNVKHICVFFLGNCKYCSPGSTKPRLVLRVEIKCLRI